MATIGRKKRKPRDITKPVPLLRKPVAPRIPVAMMIRMFLLGSVAVAASGYAIYRHYEMAPLPMRMRTVPVTSSSSTTTKTMTVEVDGGEVEVEILP